MVAHDVSALPAPPSPISVPPCLPPLLAAEEQRSRGALADGSCAHCHCGRFHEQEQDPEYRDGEEVVPSEFPTAEQVKHLAKMFQQADTDGSGSLTKDEVRASLFIFQVHEVHEVHEELSHCFLRALQPVLDPAFVRASCCSVSATPSGPNPAKNRMSATPPA